MIVELDPVFEPDDVGPGFSSGHANENDFVSENIFVIEVRRFRYTRTLMKTLSVKLISKETASVCLTLYLYVQYFA